jgi:hypothetical protein
VPGLFCHLGSLRGELLLTRSSTELRQQGGCETVRLAG